MAASYVSHTDEQIRRMLDKIGIGSPDELFSGIEGASLETPDGPTGMSEHQLRSRFAALSRQVKPTLNFQGFGIYPHIRPSAVSALSSLPQFLTSYTPYQAELSQGVLQSIFEFQSYICELTGLDVANASLYDGPTAALEAIHLMKRVQPKRNRVLVSGTVHPFTLEVVQPWAELNNIEIIFIPVSGRQTDIAGAVQMIDEMTIGCLVQTPNRYGVIENYQGLAERLHEKKSLLAVSSDPLSLMIQKNAGEWNADIAIGEAQSLGLPVFLGGATCGYMSVNRALMRKIPGRVVGQSVDSRGERAFCLTLQTREQHITRYRSTSNICSNHAHHALQVTIYLALMGKSSLKEAALQSYHKAHYLHGKLKDIRGVEVDTAPPFFCEFPVRISSSRAFEMLIEKAAERDISPGVILQNYTKESSDENLLLIACTEIHAREDLDTLAALIQEVCG